MATSFVTSQGFENIDGHRINVTARLDTENRQHMAVLVEKTIKLWLYVAKKIAAGERSAEYNVTPEDAIEKNHFTPLAEERCTVWGDTANGAGFTVHSSYTAQDALDVFWARHDALMAFKSMTEPPTQQNTPQTQSQGQSTPNAPSTPLNANSGHSSSDANGVTKVSGKKAAAALVNGSLFELPIYQIKLRSKDDSQYYEVYTKYGSNLGQYPELSIYTDNEIAKQNGVLDFLAAFGLTPGKDKMGEWVLRGVVKDKGDKKNLYAVSIREAA